MKHCLKIILLMIVLYIIFYDNSKVAFSEKNPYDSNIIGELKIKGFHNNYKIKILFHDIHDTKICDVVLYPSYDCDYDIYEDIDYVRWKSKDIFQIKIKEKGRLDYWYKTDFVYLNSKCEVKSKLHI